MPLRHLVAAVLTLGLINQADAQRERGGGARGGGGGGGGDGGYSRGGAASAGGLSSGGSTAAQGSSRRGAGQQATGQQTAGLAPSYSDFNFKRESECAPEFGEFDAGNLQPEPG